VAFDVRRPLSTVVALCSVSAIACSEPSPVRSVEATLVASADTVDGASTVLASRQRRLNTLLASSDNGAADLIAREFTLYDALRPEDATRDWQGRMSRGQDYFRILSREFPASFGEIESLQVLPAYVGRVSVVVKHPGHTATITTWAEQDSTWKAVSMTINASDSIVVAFYTRYQNALRSQ
jgi:hypothetical protein